LKVYPAVSLRTITLMLSCAVSIAACCREPVQGSPSEMPSSTPAPTAIPESNDPFTQNACLGRGINLANALEAPAEGVWGVTLEEEYFQIVKDAGFDAVRIPIRWSGYADDAPPYGMDPAFFERVDWAVEQALSRGLLVVINIHNYEKLEMYPDAHRDRFLAIWAQIAEHYQDYPDDLLFEILNEPHGELDALWNDLLVEALDVVRATNPERNVVIGPVQWNNVNALPLLELPEDDRHIIVTVHYYNPFPFTHQGAEWVSGSYEWTGTRWGTEADKRAVIADFDKVAAWAKEHDRPIYVGEFGAYWKADMEDRVLWTDFVARQAEARGMSWAYWEFCSSFGVYDTMWGAWYEDLLGALIPAD
jgi:endoglucanase